MPPVGDSGRLVAIMFKSVADIAAERLATAHNTTSAAQDDASPGQQRYSEREDAQRRNRNQDAFSVQMDKPGSLYEAERARERELEREGGHQSPLDRVRELELHVARTKGNSLAGNSVSALRSSRYVLASFNLCLDFRP